jgi:hypothetical protein
MLEIKDIEIKKKISFLLNNLWYGKFSHVFPQQTCDYLERRNLFKLKNFLYYFYKKNTKNEKKALLFLFTDGNCDRKSVIIFKDLVMYDVNIECSCDYYKNSLFDITVNSVDSKIVIYDTIYSSGIQINAYTFIDRITEAENFKKNTTNPRFDVCSYLEELGDLNNSLIQFEEEIFMISNNMPIIVGINRGCFKWQPINSIYFSLKVVEDENNLLLYTSNYKKDVLFAKINFSDIDGEIYINKIKNLNNYKNECVIDIGLNENCKLDDNDNEIIIIRVSDNYPSSLRHIEKLLYIKKEKIDIHEIM